jgi:organic hydroperoxide reductase OsmC/OhrA
MSEHEVTVRWGRGAARWDYESYVRDHEWSFGTGTTIAASAAQDFRGNASLPNPEEALVGALSSCHMLTLLAICARRGVVVESYEDHAVGHLEKNAAGRLAVTRVTLRPRIVFAEGHRPDAEALAALHEQSHRGCFIANSVTTVVEVKPDPT